MGDYVKPFGQNLTNEKQEQNACGKNCFSTGSLGLIMDIKQQYKESATHALAGFQLLEQELKDYIGYYHEAAHLLLKDHLSYSFTKDDINEAPLGKLCTVFSKINSNKNLLESIRSLIKHRNKLAHKALTNLYGISRPDSELNSEIDELIEIAKKLDEIMNELHKETFNIIQIKKKASGSS